MLLNMYKRRYRFPSGIKLVSNIIKNYNTTLIEKIGVKMSLSKYEVEELKYKFIKANYYIPQIVKTDKEAYIKNMM